MFLTYTHGSKTLWGSNDSDGKLTLDQIQTGCLQRIATATEAMAQNYTRLQSDRDMYQRLYNEESERLQQSERSNAALRGQITKLRKRLI